MWKQECMGMPMWKQEKKNKKMCKGVNGGGGRYCATSTGSSRPISGRSASGSSGAHTFPPRYYGEEVTGER